MNSNIFKLIKSQLQSIWQDKSSLLKEKIIKAHRELEIILNDINKTRKSSDNFGEFASNVMDENKLYNLLSRKNGKEKYPSDRKEGITNAKNILEKSISSNFSNLPDFKFVKFKWDDSPSELLPQLESHFHTFAEIFFALRIAEFEQNASYSKHKEIYKKGSIPFTKITRQEWELTSVFAVYEEIVLSDPFKLFPSIIKIAEKPYPVKLIIIEKQPNIPNTVNDEEEFISSEIPSDLAILVSGLQKIHYFQSPAEMNKAQFSDRLEKLWKTGSSSLIRLFTGNLPDSEDNNVSRAALGRYVPWFEYNPHLDFNFANCISLEGNQNIEEFWGHDFYQNSGSKEDRTVTFADFICQQNFAPGQFREPTANEKKKPIGLIQYLEFDIWNRQYYYPTVKDILGKVHIPSLLMVALTVEKAKIWRTLQNYVGIANPVIEKIKTDLEIKHKKEMEEAIFEQRNILIQQKEKEIEQVLNSAFHNLVVNLLNDGSEEKLKSLILSETISEPFVAPVLTNGHSSTSKVEVNVSPTVNTAVKEEVKKAPSTEAWIESKLCTACDECTTINRSIFAYNSDKQAFIKDPKAGPYRDIVKAAEKCSAGIIHPGMPLDKSEKDLDKLIKRAEKYQ
jgi:pyruvate-ferredoxin/flavodoxin oxidoreductase